MPKKKQPETTRIITKNAGLRSYETDTLSRPNNRLTFDSVRSMTELRTFLESDKKVQIDGHVICANEKGQYFYKRVNRESFISGWDKNAGVKKMREATDFFDGQDSGGGNLIGNDFTPLLGGPFNKQLYIYDALKMYALCFFAYNHDPVAHAIVHITRDFTLGRGFRIDAKHTDPKRQAAAMAVWSAFAEVNDLHNKFDNIAKEISRDGEVMIYWLPNKAVNFVYPIGGPVSKGLLPRIRLMDPSTCWEIVTQPEDISNVSFYQFVYPTQYSIYTHNDATGEMIPSSKFIVMQVPAAEMDHFKINCSSNEKRGRSDLFPALGYLKRLRDTIEYEIVRTQKNAAWSIDTTVEGSQSDLDAYAQSQEAMGTIPAGGSEFVHTSKIKREYLGNSRSSATGGNPAVEWSLSMAMAAVQIPVSYLGTHLSGGQTKASAIVATEPVAKKFEMRQSVYENILHKMWKRVMAFAGLDDVTCEVTFPEIIVQDRSMKIKDIKIAEDSGYISRERAAIMVSKELGITEYDYASEKEKIELESPAPVYPGLLSPLTTPPASEEPKGNSSAITGQDKRDLSMRRG